MAHNDKLMPNSPSGIDVNFDFTSDTPGFWDGFWKRNSGLGLEAPILMPRVLWPGDITRYCGAAITKVPGDKRNQRTIDITKADG